MKRNITLSLMALVALWCVGCAAYDQAYDPKVDIPAQDPIFADANPSVDQWESSDGSLWPKHRAVSHFTDDKAYLKGDIVVVNVIQETKGTSTANTDTSRESSISATIKWLFGFEESVNDLTNYTNVAADGTVSDWDPTPLVEASSSNSFKGDATTGRSDTLEATISAVVTDVLSNGNLVIFGSQIVTLNNESRVLTVQGIVRPSDVTSDNTVESSQIAMANIEFSGDGVVSEKQRVGWGTRVFDYFWIF